MLHLDPAIKGKYIKLNLQWVKLDNISKVDKGQGSNGKELTIKYKDKKGTDQQIIYSGPLTDHVESQLRKEGKVN